MHVVVLQRPGSAAPCDRWILQEAPGTRVTVVSSHGTVRPDSDLGPGVRRVLVDDYDSDAAVLGELFRICREDRPDRLFANSEDDVLRAAEVRTLFDIEGQRSASALAFRDKVAMKALFAGLATPAVPYRPLGCLEDVFAARRQFGAVVVKPRDGAGAVQVRVFHDDDAIRYACIADPAWVTSVHTGRLMAERYVPGAVYHVDVVVDGSAALLVSASRYRCPPHRYATDNSGSIMLDESSPARRVLTGAAREFVRRLPAGHGVSILHLEFLADEPGLFFAGEVACRSGGALIRNSIRYTYGVDTSRLACLIAVGLWRDTRELTPVAAPTGWLLWTGGRRLAAPADHPDWLLEHVVSDRPGKATSAVDGKAAFLVRGANEDEIARRFAALSAGDPVAVPRAAG
ncbi:ATP-grasp domain-containing protein [Dactylosporangium sp. CA-139066]|uniref:ATP-grasp domain-containing protein n=1 Tax=Dactylosporangium sp. CA-139066 TaxID=3239930 RepID=UPI003D9204D1